MDFADSCSISSVDTLAVGLVGVLVVDSVVETSALGFFAELFVPEFVASSSSLCGYSDMGVLSTCAPLGCICSRCPTYYHICSYRGPFHRNHTPCCLQFPVSWGVLVPGSYFVCSTKALARYFHIAPRWTPQLQSPY